MSLLIVQWSGSLETLCHFNNIRMYVCMYVAYRARARSPVGARITKFLSRPLPFNRGRMISVRYRWRVSVCARWTRRVAASRSFWPGRCERIGRVELV